ncbi:hypothetical protein E3P77_00611 [Wallemia ichthyophaga]|nr:hypothetical protein E3P77_00611 [Wallemia ichthyophaga]
MSETSVKEKKDSQVDEELGVDSNNMDNLRNTIQDIHRDENDENVTETQAYSSIDGSSSPTTSTSTTSSKSLSVQRKSITHAHNQPTVKTPPSTWFKPSMKRIKMNISEKDRQDKQEAQETDEIHDDHDDNDDKDSQLVSFVKAAFMAFDNTNKEEYAAYFSPYLKCTINALPYTVDGLKDVYNYITSAWVTAVQVGFKHVIEHPRLMGKLGEGEVGAVAELSGRDIFGTRHRVNCLFTMVVCVDEENVQEVKEYVEVMSYDS